MKLLIGTQNKDKQAEFLELLSDLSHVELLLPADIPDVASLDPKEAGSTFKDIARDKAQAFADSSQITSVSDDSGLCVTALGGKPGIHSKRFFPGTDHDRNIELMRLLEHTEDRSAYFVSTLALYNPKNKEVNFFEGKVTGFIAFEERGTDGFGYDPIFIPDGYEQSFASLGQDVKNKVSHRKRAISKLVDYLQSL